jgi:hypothetical protein
MTCDDVRPRLTAYLDGDLDPDRGTVVRGHLRTCDACRRISEQESVLRDELRSLPTLDPPSALWTNIQAQLADAEVAEAKRPGWKRALARWTPMLPRFAMGGALAAAAVGILWWRTHESVAPQPQKMPAETALVEMPSPRIEASAPVVAAHCNLDAPAGTDVTTDLAGEPARITACYAMTANELLALVAEARPAWTDEQRQTFDAQVAELHQAVTRAGDERPRQRAYRALNRYLQTTLTRDQVALASALP